MSYMSNKDTNFFAETNFRNKKQKFGIKRGDRRQHMYVIGKTGVGKTVLLKNMALQDIENGEGVAIIDPHGEFVEEVLDKIPSYRMNDVVYFNPADTEYPISFNILDVHDLKYKHLVASGLMGIFTKIWANVWSPRMEYILDNCILALLDTPGTTLLGILRILADNEYRQKIINNVQDPVVKSFWLNEYANWPAQYKNEAIAPIQNKVGQFLNVSLVRNIVGQPKSTINVSEIMDSQKILLVNVSKGKVGEDNSALLGAMIITKIQLAAMERVRIAEEKRKDFYLYVDEFQNFVTESFANILSEARKYRLNLIVAHQYIGQLITTESTEKVRDAVFGNAGTLIIFRVGATDAEFLEREFAPTFIIQDLVNLPNYNIYLKMMIEGITSQPFSAATLPAMIIGDGKNNREKIIYLSREKYARPKKEVEERITNWAKGLEAGILASPRQSPSGLYDANCFLCKKPTKVVFPPDGKRPVYCKPCLKKVEEQEKMAGALPGAEEQKKILDAEEQKKMPFSSPVFPKKTEDFNELEKLGIEFSSPNAVIPAKRNEIYPTGIEKNPIEELRPPYGGIKPLPILSDDTHQLKPEGISGGAKKEIPSAPSLEELLSREPISFKPKKEEKNKQGSDKKNDDDGDKEELKQALRQALIEEKKKDQIGF